MPTIAQLQQQWQAMTPVQRLADQGWTPSRSGDDGQGYSYGEDGNQMFQNASGGSGDDAKSGSWNQGQQPNDYRGYYADNGVREYDVNGINDVINAAGMTGHMTPQQFLQAQYGAGSLQTAPDGKQWYVQSNPSSYGRNVSANPLPDFHGKHDTFLDTIAPAIPLIIATVVTMGATAPALAELATTAETAMATGAITAETVGEFVTPEMINAAYDSGVLTTTQAASTLSAIGGTAPAGTALAGDIASGLGDTTITAENVAPASTATDGTTTAANGTVNPAAPDVPNTPPPDLNPNTPYVDQNPATPGTFDGANAAGNSGPVAGDTSAAGTAGTISTEGSTVGSTSGLSLKDIQDGYRVVNGVKTLVGAGSGTSPASLQSPVSAGANNGVTGSTSASTNSDGSTGTLTAAQIAAGVTAGYSLLSGNDPVSLANNNATLHNQVATTAQQQANINFDFYRQNYMPVEAALTADSLKAGSPEMQDQRAGQAGATVTQAASNAAAADQLRKDQMGIRPDSGNSEAMANDRTIGTAANVAAAENNARQNERIYGDTMRTSTAGLGRGLQNAGTALSNAATNAAQASTQGAATTAALNQQQATNLGALATNVSGMNLGQYFQPSTPVFDAATKAYDPSSTDSFFAKGGRVNVGVYQSDPKTVDASFLPRNRSFIRPPSRTHGYMKGGMARGPGTGTSDSIPVDIQGRPGAIANGEYVLNAKATKMIGTKKLDAMNLKGLPKGSRMKDGRHYEKGGVVGEDAQRYVDRITETKGSKTSPGAAPQPSNGGPSAAIKKALTSNENYSRGFDATNEPVINQTKFAVGGRVASTRYFPAPRRAA